MTTIGTIVGSSLGTLYVKITADSIELVKGMAGAVESVESGSAVMAKRLEGLAVTAAASLAVIGTIAVREFAKFDAAMTHSLAIMDDVSMQTRKQMEARARDLAKNSITSAEDLAKAYYYLASSGLNAKQSQEALNTVNKFAIAGNFSLEVAVSRLADANTALGLRSKDATENMQNMARVSDVLARADQIANASIEQFSAALTNHAAAALRLANKSVEEGVAVLAAYADQGIKGQLAGEQLYIVLRDLQRVASQNAEVFQLLNVRVFDSRGNMRNMADIVKDLDNAMTGMSVAEKRMTIELMGFQDRSMSALLTLLGTSDRIREYQRELEKAGGTTEKVANKQQTSFNAQLTVTWHLFQDLAISIGEKMAPGLLKLNDIIQQSMRDTNGWRAGLEGLAEKAIPAVIKGIEQTRIGMWGLDKALTESEIGKQFQKHFGGAGSQNEKELQASSDAIAKRTAKLRAARRYQEMSNYQDAGAISLDEWDKIEKKMKETTAATKEFKAAESEAFDMSAFQEQYQMLLNYKKVQERINDMKMPRESSIGGLNRFMDPDIRATRMILEERKEAEDQLKYLKEIDKQKVLMTDATLKKKLELQEAYNKRLKNLQQAETLLVVQSSQKIFDGLATIAGAWAGKQSGIYKAMFAASKAFAIAESIIKIQQGIAEAASLPWPLNLTAIASVVAATASIVSTIQAVKLEFSGEARAMGGPVTAGKSYLVGEKGMELFTPSQNGTIIPNDQLTGGRSVRVEVHNYGDGQATVERSQNGMEELIKVVVKKTEERFASDFLSGRGILPKTVEQTYRLRRAQP